MSNYDRRPPPAYEQIRVLEDMVAKLEAERDRLREKVEHLKALNDAYMAELEKLRRSCFELTAELEGE
jgi:predicted RNase H-like nuclease (RuvC/YqgF family)